MTAKVTIFSIGFTQRTAEDFFSTPKQAGVRRLMDVRLNNTSQLAAFAKRDDLRYFLHELCEAEYIHEPLLAPTQEMLDAYKKEKGSWAAYEAQFVDLMTLRRIEEHLDHTSFNLPTALLCSEYKAEHCHRRLVMEYLARAWNDIGLSHL